MTRYLSGLLVLLFSYIAHAEYLLVQNITLIDMTGNDLVNNASILINDGIIEEVWPEGERVSNDSIFKDANLIDGTGKYLLPAFIDSHVHYNWYMGELFLSHGITNVNDLGSRIHWQVAVQKGLNSGKLRGPRYFFCGRIGGESPANYASVAQQSFFATASQIDEVVGAVSEIGSNADCVRQNMDTPELLFKAINRETNLAGMSVISHSYDVRYSAEVGVNGIEHLEGVALATIRSSEGLKAVEEMNLEEGHKHPLLYQWMEEKYFDEVINTLLDKDMYLNPTLIHEWKGVIDRTLEFEADDIYLFSHPSLQYIPIDERLVSLGQYHWADLAIKGVTDDQQIFVNNSYFIPAKGLKQKLDKGYANIQMFLRRYVNAGGKLYSGTDTAASNTPGISLHHEMQLLVDAGITEMAALASSTRWAAEILRIDDRFGTVEIGKIADLVILDANPLDNIANTKKISQVIMSGKVVDIGYHADYAFPFHQHGPVSKHLYHRQPVISSVIPALIAQDGEKELSIIGQNFMPESVGLFNGVVTATKYINRTRLIIQLDSRQMLQPGSHLISVQTPAPGGGIAIPFEFIIDYQ